MNKLNCALLAMLAVSATASAKQLTPGEALQEAGLVNHASKVLRAPSSLNLAMTVGDSRFNACYVFTRSNEKGFVIVSADDEVTPLLGYSDTEVFDPDNLPLGLQAMLKSYESQIRYAATHPRAAAKGREVAAKASSRKAVAPLCSTKWNQSEPYNDMCPEINGVRAVTGCVATALAQVMKVHNWPPKGNGSNSYELKIGDDQTMTVSSNFAAHTYDWARMLDVYTGAANAKERAAVAQLMVDCGVASFMTYRTSSSGAIAIRGARGLVEYFDYAKDMRWVNRLQYYLDDWIDMAYTEVSNGRPIFMTGVNSAAGHAFVCDGYSNNNYFHINWGWGGISDGYFLLTLLDPMEQGIGGSADGYTDQLAMLIGCKPSDGKGEIVTSVVNDGGFLMPNTLCNRTSAVSFGSSNLRTIYYNNSLKSISGNLGIRLINKDTNEESYLWSTSKFDYAPATGVYAFSIIGTKFPEEGDYRITPVFKDSEEAITDVLVDISGPIAMDLHVGSRLQFTPVYVDGITKVANYIPKADYSVGEPMAFETVITTTTPEYAGVVVPQLLNKSGEVVATGAGRKFNVTPTQPQTYLWVVNMEGLTKPGSYKLNLADQSTGSSLGMFDVTVGSNPGQLKYNYATFTVQPGVESGKFSKTYPAIIDRQSDIVVTIPVTSGQFIDRVYLGYGNGAGGLRAMSEPQFAAANAGQTITLTFEHPFSSIRNDETYAMMVMGAVNGRLSDFGATKRIWFQVTGEESGVDQIGADQTVVELGHNPVDNEIVVMGQGIKQVVIYNLSGMPVLEANGKGSDALTINASALTQGHYIVRVSTANGPVAKRIIKR